MFPLANGALTTGLRPARPMLCARGRCMFEAAEGCRTTGRPAKPFTRTEVGR